MLQFLNIRKSVTSTTTNHSIQHCVSMLPLRMHVELLSSTALNTVLDKQQTDHDQQYSYQQNEQENPFLDTKSTISNPNSGWFDYFYCWV
eukprot:UN08438